MSKPHVPARDTVPAPAATGTAAEADTGPAAIAASAASACIAAPAAADAATPVFADAAMLAAAAAATAAAIFRNSSLCYPENDAVQSVQTVQASKQQRKDCNRNVRLSRPSATASPNCMQ